MNMKKIAALLLSLTLAVTFGAAMAETTGNDPQISGEITDGFYYLRVKLDPNDAGAWRVDDLAQDQSVLSLDGVEETEDTLTARYAPEGKRVDRVLSEMEGKDDREAYFETAVVCVFPDGSEIAESARVMGHITRERRGDNNFGYDPVFFCDEMGKTYAEMTLEEKNVCSHRARAFRKFKEALEKRTGEKHDQ